MDCPGTVHQPDRPLSPVPCPLSSVPCSSGSALSCLLGSAMLLCSPGCSSTAFSQPCWALVWSWLLPPTSLWSFSCIHPDCARTSTSWVSGASPRVKQRDEGSAPLLSQSRASCVAARNDSSVWFVFLPMAPLSSAAAVIPGLAAVTVALALLSSVLLSHLLCFHVYLSKTHS